MSIRVKFILIMLLAVVAAILVYPREDTLLSKLGFKDAKLQVKQGLDLQGGAQLVFEADLAKTPEAERQKAINSLIGVIQRRANPAGTSEINIQRQGSNRVIVELPGEENVEAAIKKIGQTAQLIFLQTPADNPAATIETGITGKDVERADVDFDVQTNQPIVSLKLKGEAVKKFGDLTTQLNKSGGRLTTLLDQDIIFGPATVSSPITDGNAQLQGNFSSVAEARTIAELITGGALPVPIQLVEQRTVGATLGQESISRSVIAGIIGLTIVALFMISYYRLAGVVAVAALVIYTLLAVAIFKLTALTPYTIVLTLAGAAGFILSIGMAVDANILIFERMKEELRRGKSFLNAVETGFDRAWLAIRDANVSTLITCFILYFTAGASAPIIKGFAVTLGLGVLISMFTAIVISRTFLRILIRQKWATNPVFFGLPRNLEVKK